MKRLLLICGLLWSAIASAQFTPGQLLTAAELNSQFALYAPLAGATFSGPVTIPSLTVTSTFTLPAQAANTLLGNSTGTSASPIAVAVSNCSGTSSALNYTGGSGFSCNASINAVTLGGATFSAPGPIGSVSTSSGAFSSVSTPSATIGGGTINATSIGATSASTGAFTTLAASSTVSGTGFSTYLASPPAIGSTTPAAGNFSTLSASGTISGTGFSSFLASPTSIGSTTANSGAFTTLSSTGNFTPAQTNGIVGTNTNNSPNAGSVGEIIQSTVLGGSAVGLTANVGANITSISLTAGDWDVCGETITLPAGTTTQASLITGISLTSATIPALSANTTYVSLPYAVAAGVSVGTSAGCVTERFASTTTVFLAVQSNFSVSTNAAFGWIYGRRRR